MDDDDATPQPEIDLSDTLTGPSSEDTWKGIVPVTRPLVPLGDDVSSVMLFVCVAHSLFFKPTLLFVPFFLNRRAT